MAMGPMGNMGATGMMQPWGGAAMGYHGMGHHPCAACAPLQPQPQHRGSHHWPQQAAATSACDVWPTMGGAGGQHLLGSPPQTQRPEGNLWRGAWDGSSEPMAAGGGGGGGGGTTSRGGRRGGSIRRDDGKVSTAREEANLRNVNARMDQMLALQAGAVRDAHRPQSSLFSRIRDGATTARGGGGGGGGGGGRGGNANATATGAPGLDAAYGGAGAAAHQPHGQAGCYGYPHQQPCCGGGVGAMAPMGTAAPQQHGYGAGGAAAYGGAAQHPGACMAGAAAASGAAHPCSCAGGGQRLQKKDSFARRARRIFTPRGQTSPARV